MSACVYVYSQAQVRSCMVIIIRRAGAGQSVRLTRGGVGGTREIKYTQLQPWHFLRAYLSKNENNAHLSACFHPLFPMYFEKFTPKRCGSQRVVTTIPRCFCCPQQGRRSKGRGQGHAPNLFIRHQMGYPFLEPSFGSSNFYGELK